MNVKNLWDNYPKLISYMEANGYSKTYIDEIKREIKKILAAIDAKKASSYADIYLEYTKTLNSSSLHTKRTIIEVIEQFDVHSRCPDKRDAYSLLLPEFKSIIDYYCEVEKKRGRKITSIYTQSHNASTFFFSLQKKGIDSLILKNT